MNREDARKLLGGYATGNLTAEESRLLFEAALDDQELFDALAEEQALKDVLDDPVSRERVRLAVAAAPRKRGWWTRPWIWVPSVGALSAAVLTVALINWKPGVPTGTAKNATIADSRTADGRTPDRRTLEKEAPAAIAAPARDAKVPSAKPAAPKVSGKIAGAAQTPAPPPAAAVAKDEASPREPAEAPAQSTARAATNTAANSGSPGNTRSDGENAQQQNVGQQSRREQQQAPATGAGVAPAPPPRSALLARQAERASAAPLAWSLVRDELEGRESELAGGTRPRVGDRVRLRVTTAAAGYLEVSLRDSSGAWQPRSKRIAVAANAVYTIPPSPVEVESGSAMRLTWWPAGALMDQVQSGNMSMSRKSKLAEDSKSAPAKAASGGEVVIDIPLR